MKHRFIVLNLIIILLFCFISIGFNHYYQLKDSVVGNCANEILDKRESVVLDKLGTIKLSIYSIDASELSRVREDILTEFTEDDFQSLIIQPKASFIDTLLYDSKLKKYLEQSNTKKPSKSLLNKMKLYLPNELLISFLSKIGTMEQLSAIETYLTENGYEFISSSNIPSVKSNMKHYYYDKNLFSDSILQISNITKEREQLKSRATTLFKIELSGYVILFLILTLLIQLLDFYLFTISKKRIRFLLKGHINPRTYTKKVVIKKSIGLFAIFVIVSASLLLKFNFFTTLYENKAYIIFILLSLFANLLFFIIKRERIIKLS